MVTTDVPPHVEVFGNPARIIGYGSSQPPTQRVEDSFAGGDVGVGGSRLVNLPTLADLRGSLTFAEVGGQLPFTPQRLFMVYQVPSGEVRGEHAHRELHQLLLCVAGACTVAVDDGRARIEVTLDDPSVALYVPPLVWDTLYGFSPDAQLVVLASDVYDPQDYIRDYDEFVQVANASHR
ncbi:MAG: hypothetical protein HKN44_13265 [Ilumatobacter sp.]|nr:hypothetical protein [Ilumatobacter sp.]